MDAVVELGSVLKHKFAYLDYSYNDVDEVPRHRGGA